MALPASLKSPLYEVRQTTGAGRGVFALQDIEAGTKLLETAELAASAILKEYRKEVCLHCFNYDRGRNWPLRDASTGFVFCSDICRDRWKEENGGHVLEAYQSVQNLIRSTKPSSNSDETMVNIDDPRPSPSAITSTWSNADARADSVRNARLSSQPSKRERRELSDLQSATPHGDLIVYLLSAVITAVRDPDLWAETQNLHAAPSPYLTEAVMQSHVTSYLQLLAVLPAAYLPYVNTRNMMTLASRDANNAFGLRSLDDGGDEFFGFGVWPFASFWNHACCPNVEKARNGRSWHFSTARGVKAGDELCISYLGVGSQDMDREERRRRLREGWSFDCLCDLCSDV